LPLLGRNVVASSFVRYLALVWAESSLFGIGFYLVLLVQRSAEVFGLKEHEIPQQRQAGKR